MVLLEGESAKSIFNDDGVLSYSITDFGRIFSHFNNKWCKLHLTECGYYCVNIAVSRNKNKRKKIHRLVAENFLPKIDPTKIQINHKDHNKTNNHVSNLEWCTSQENIEKYFKFSEGNYIRSHRNKFLTWEDVTKMRELMSNGLSYRKAAAMFGCNRQHASDIARNRKWKI